MKTGISEIADEIRFSDGSKGMAYTALRPLICAACGDWIMEGKLFTRRRQSGQGLALSPRCQDCMPFEPIAKVHEQSKLIGALLTPKVEEKTAEHRTKSKELVERRLGSILKRNRKAG
jgi:hypothetical protein